MHYLIGQYYRNRFWAHIFWRTWGMRKASFPIKNIHYRDNIIHNNIYSASASYTASWWIAKHPIRPWHQGSDTHSTSVSKTHPRPNPLPPHHQSSHQPKISHAYPTTNPLKSRTASISGPLAPDSKFFETQYTSRLLVTFFAKDSFALGPRSWFPVSLACLAVSCSDILLRKKRHGNSKRLLCKSLKKARYLSS